MGLNNEHSPPVIECGHSTIEPWKLYVCDVLGSPTTPWIHRHTTQIQGDLPTPLTHINNNNTQQHTTTALEYIKLPLFKKLWDNFFCGTITLWAISRDILRGPRLFWPLNCPECKSLAPLKISLEIDHKVIVPQKNYVPLFLKQRYINSYYVKKDANFASEVSLMFFNSVFVVYP